MSEKLDKIAEYAADEILGSQRYTERVEIIRAALDEAVAEERKALRLRLLELRDDAMAAANSFGRGELGNPRSHLQAEAGGISAAISALDARKAKR